MDVVIDYNRKMVIMDVVLDNSSYNSKGVNIALPTMRTNLLIYQFKIFFKILFGKRPQRPCFLCRYY